MIIDDFSLVAAELKRIESERQNIDQQNDESSDFEKLSELSLPMTEDEIAAAQAA